MAFKRCLVNSFEFTPFIIRVHAWFQPFLLQLLLRSETKYFSKGSIIADSHDKAKALMVINSGMVCISNSRAKSGFVESNHAFSVKGHWTMTLDEALDPTSKIIIKGYIVYPSCS